MLSFGHGSSRRRKASAVAAGFHHERTCVFKIGSLSRTKGLVVFARLVLERPGLLILDEPTNHINFRHLPIIAKALDHYEGAMIRLSRTRVRQTDPH